MTNKEFTITQNFNIVGKVIAKTERDAYHFFNLKILKVCSEDFIIKDFGEVIHFSEAECKKKSIPQILRELRKEKGFTLQKMAEEIGTTKGYLWEVENKETCRPSAELLFKVSKVLGVSMESFFV